MGMVRVMGVVRMCVVRMLMVVGVMGVFFFGRGVVCDLVPMGVGGGVLMVVYRIG